MHPFSPFPLCVIATPLLIFTSAQQLDRTEIELSLRSPLPRDTEKYPVSCKRRVDLAADFCLLGGRRPKLFHFSRSVLCRVDIQTTITCDISPSQFIRLKMTSRTSALPFPISNAHPQGMNPRGRRTQRPFKPQQKWKIRRKEEAEDCTTRHCGPS